MKLESALKYFNPKTQNFLATAKTTGTDSLTGTDLMGAIGYCQSKAPFGISAVMAKNGGSDLDAYRTVEQLTQYANRTAPKLLRKAAGAKLGRCLVVLSKLAFDEYSRSAATTAPCSHCSGTGFIEDMQDVMKYPGHFSSLTGEEIIPPRFNREMVKTECSHCEGKGAASVRCRCNGTGRMRDIEASRRTGAPVDHDCERCSGRGFKRSPSSAAHRAINALLPDLTQSSWSRNWKPFFESLVTKCEVEESHADCVFRNATK